MSEHEHGEENKTFMYIRIGLAVILCAASFLPFFGDIADMILFAVAYLIVGYDVIIGSVADIFRRHELGENLLMTLASVGAFALGEYLEAVAVMLLYQIGELLEDAAVDKSRDAIGSLASLRSDKVKLIGANGEITEVSPEEIKAGDIFEVRPGELIPIDGVIIFGSGGVDTAALTGESLPLHKKQGDEVLGGSMGLSGLLKIKATADYGDSTVAKILKLVEESEERKSPTEGVVKKFTKIYTPIVLVLALFVAFALPVILKASFGEYIYKALVFLAISCPCAFVISVPLSYFAGIGGASRKGILIKGANFIDLLADTKRVVFDKTGTLTDGRFRITSVDCVGGVSKSELLYAAAVAESLSDHPIAKAICRYSKVSDKADSIEEISGKGTVAFRDGQWYVAGSASLMEEWVSRFKQKKKGTVVYIAKSGKYLGSISLEASEKKSAGEAVKQLTDMGIAVSMLTGDNENAAAYTAEKLGISDYKSGLLPQEKVETFENGKAETGTSVFVGDGINDAPVLKLADVGIAMGGVGSDAAIESADVVVMDDDLRRIPSAISHSKRVKRIVMQNIIFSLSVKVIIMLLGLFGYMWLWLSILADVGVCLLAILNSLRALKK